MNSDTNASIKKYSKEIQEKRKEETFSSEKWKKKMKNIKKSTNEEMNKNEKNENLKSNQKKQKNGRNRKKGKRGAHPRRAQNFFFT